MLLKESAWILENWNINEMEMACHRLSVRINAASLDKKVKVKFAANMKNLFCQKSFS